MKLATRPVLAIDLDDVLLETTVRLKKDIFRVTSKLGIARATATRIYLELRTKQFTFEAFARALATPALPRVRILNNLHALLAPPRQYTYPSAEDFLRHMQRTHRLLLVSYGAPTFQRAKIAQARLAPYVSEIIITSDPTKHSVLVRLQKKYGQQLLLLDDSLIVQREAARLGVAIIRIKKSHKDAAYYRALASRIAHKKTL